jgi:hypothetical protein
MTLPGDGKMVLDVTAKTRTDYRRYDKIEIDLPDEVRKILDPGSAGRP